jgi:hypothetical protein
VVVHEYADLTARRHSGAIGHGCRCAALGGRRGRDAEGVAHLLAGEPQRLGDVAMQRRRPDVDEVALQGDVLVGREACEQQRQQDDIRQRQP